MNTIRILNKFILIKIFCGIFFIASLNPMISDLDLAEELSLEEIEEYETQEPLRATPPLDILELLRIILQGMPTPLWTTTKPPKGRNILYLIPHKITAIEYGGLDLNLFFNMTNKMDVTFGNLFALDSKFKKIIDFILSKISPHAASSLMPLLRKVSIQERKVGGLLQAGFIYKFFNVQLHTSFQLSERNFWLTKKDQTKIQEIFESKAPPSRGGGGSSSLSSFQFNTNELYRMKYGLGDTRAKIGLNALNTSNVQLDIGFEGIIPTAEKQILPEVDHQHPPTKDEFTTWLIDNLKPIRDNLINPQLGNNGHWGFGFFIESKITLFHNAFNLWNRFSVDSFFKGIEHRLMLFKKTIAQDDLTSDPEDISRFLKENVFPQPFKVTIKPGNIFNFVSSMNINISRRWMWGIGYDLFIQQNETIKKIHDKDVEPYALRVEAAQVKRATQHKVFTETNYVIKNNDWNLILGIGGDTTFSSKNIGHDWTVYLRIGAYF